MYKLKLVRDKQTLEQTAVVLVKHSGGAKHLLTKDAEEGKNHFA